MDVASHCPAVLQAVQTAIEAAHVRSSRGNNEQGHSIQLHLAPRIWIEAILLRPRWVPGLLEPAEEARGWDLRMWLS